MSDSYARNHFNRYINGAYRDVQNLYKASRDDMKRFIMLDTLVNSLEVDGRPLPYEDIHNPPAQQEYKMFPTDAAKIMPTFGEIVSYNRNSYDVNYQRWDAYEPPLLSSQLQPRLWPDHAARPQQTRSLAHGSP